MTFLDPSTEMGRRVSKSIVQTSIDDDCATDEEIMTGSQQVMIRELTASINKYLTLGKAEVADYVKNS